jgi:hypothetical protein
MSANAINVKDECDDELVNDGDYFISDEDVLAMGQRVLVSSSFAYRMFRELIMNSRENFQRNAAEGEASPPPSQPPTAAAPSWPAHRRFWHRSPQASQPSLPRRAQEQQQCSPQSPAAASEDAREPRAA